MKIWEHHEGPTSFMVTIRDNITEPVRQLRVQRSLGPYNQAFFQFEYIEVVVKNFIFFILMIVVQIN